ncbi:undecaprenyl/decaprenyl-phosphate alpha-N-acetylglucosaminyl 1-phosphate transferase [Terrimonas sp. NA20]|uniref:Undecaprenyl/decaprenyl-phosphate alpha-N-acetylglucosaminyl 1-phosphate transferase n=1 Tax=Terrimonas ginsenosidimutans TaxID=2908004 RepID=A0ABS9KVS1_9BACT|nr:MraY family glycosyltransferase [Terrimonas ginsenosidimutans]MCG2616398.1 undecaprenyl/decaprenyl-phosphate alpha-N-acetylglucosaminyl 1-phosphate transferase [Terrimonas ginsenosidimutans]
MNNQFYLLQVHSFLGDYQSPLLSFVTAFIVTLLTIPPLIQLIRRYKLYDIPDERKKHKIPVPTMGGIAIMAGLLASSLIWLPLTAEFGQLAFFFSLLALMFTGIMDDLKDLSAKYKFAIQIAIALLIAVSGIRITSFNGLFGIDTLPLYSQFFFTVLAIVGITNAFNLVDGIDGLAGGLAFMSLITLGIFLTLSGDTNTALIAFAAAGGVLAFLYFNFNPARIFMGDTGSLVLGFTISVLCVRLLQVNTFSTFPVLPNAPVFVLGITLVPVFDTLRVFFTRTWKGGSPFQADRTHIHHLLTNNGFGHVFAVRVICFVHALVLIEVYLLRNVTQEITLAILIAGMVLVAIVLKKSNTFFRFYTKKEKLFPDEQRSIE